MTSSFNRNHPNMEQGNCSFIRRLKGQGHEEFMYVFENNVGHTYPTMRCEHCKEEWDLNDEQMKVFIKEEDIKQEKWADDHRCKDCGQPHLGSMLGSSCESWVKAGEDLMRSMGIKK